MEHASDQPELTLYMHKKRREWGRAFLVWERNEKRGYLFEDGQEKVVARGFYGLMEPIEAPPEEYEALRARLGVNLKEPRARRSSGTPTLSFDQQLQFFRTEYPEGFDGKPWQSKLRGADAKRRIKRHRDAAVLDAQKRLNQEQLRSWIAQQQYRHLWDTAVEVLKGTDLVPSNVLQSLSGAGPEQLRSLAEDLTEVLYGEGPYEARLDRFAKTVKGTFRTPSWQLVTALPALVLPNDHVCVRPTSMREQLKQLAPTLTLERWPSGAQYSSLLGVATRVQDKLKEAGEKPVDLLDIYDFVRLTTRPAAKRAQLSGSAAAERARSSAPDAVNLESTEAA